MLGGPTGMLIAFGIALTMNAFAYWNSDRMVLKMRCYRGGPRLRPSYIGWSDKWRSRRAC